MKRNRVRGNARHADPRGPIPVLISLCWIRVSGAPGDVFGLAPGAPSPESIEDRHTDIQTYRQIYIDRYNYTS